MPTSLSRALLIPVTTALAALLCAAPLPALEVGDPVVVVRPTELKGEGRQPTVLTPGTTATVRMIGERTLDVACGRIGAIDAAAVLPQAEALARFSEAIEKSPSDAKAWFSRGKLRFFKGERDGAIADLDQGLKLEPGNSEALAVRGFAWKRNGNKEKALADFDRAIQLDPRNALAWRVRGATYASLGDFEKTRADYNESIRVDPENPESLHHRVVLLSGCTEDRIRDGKQAVADATRACELTEWSNPLFVMGLGMAYSETGDFDAAIRWHTKAMESFSKAQAAAQASRLEDYRAKRPFRVMYQ